MKFPIKLNRSGVAAWAGRMLPCNDDPRILYAPEVEAEAFERSVSSLKIGSTWKSTCSGRQPLTDQMILECAAEFEVPSILEVGASSGLTSLELQDLLGGHFGRFYVTDLHFSIHCHVSGTTAYFYHPKTGACILRASDMLLIYEDGESAFFPLNVIAKIVLSRAPRLSPRSAISVDILHPRLKNRMLSDGRIILQEYDVFNPWPGAPVEIIKAANIFNRTYFSDEAILHGVRNLKNALKPKGKLVITDNREVERATLFSKKPHGSLCIDKEINGGTMIAEAVSNA